MFAKTLSFVFRLFSVLILLTVLVGVLGSTPASAASTIIVNSLADAKTVDAKCTLAEAIENANTNTATNTDCAVGSGEATYNNDYGELFNRDTFTINMKNPTSTFASVLPTAPPTPFVADLSAESNPEITCGETITEDTILTQDLACPPDAEYAIVIGASNITLDLGGHTISGYTPNTGVFATDQEGITIRNGTIEGFFNGVFIIESHRATMENLTVRNLDISDPNHFIFGIHIDRSQNVVVRDSLFEFLTVAHKEAVEIYDSFVDVYNIEVRGGGAGVSFSFAGEVCDPVNSPSNGTVRNSKFSDIYVAGIWIACSSSALIEGNDFSGCQDCILGIQGDAPFLGAVTGLTVKDNFIHDTFLGIEFRGITQSSILNNHVLDNEGWGIALRQSLGCLTPEPGWECFYSTANLIADNQTWGNLTDLYHYEEALGNTWERNTCETKDGAEIPECTPFVKSIVRASSNPSSAASVDFTVTFSESMTGVDVGDFALTKTGTISGESVTGISGGPTIYTVSVNTGSGNGTLRLDVPVSATVTDLVGNPLASLPYTSGDNYVIDKIAPTVVSSTRVNPSPANLGSVAFIVTFSEPVTGLDMVGPAFDDFTLSISAGITGAYVTGVSGSGATYTVSINTGSGNGTLRLDVVPGGNIVDLALNPLTAGFTTGEVYTLIKTATFADVPTDYWAWQFIERLYNAGITGGCSLSPLMYCPETEVTRAQMAVFLLRGEHGSAYVPPAVGTGTGFSDVPTMYWAAAWIKQLAFEGITSGCGPGLYCPETSVTRDQMAVFLLRAKHGVSYTPPPATGVFTDVPTTHWAAPFIEQLAAEGITGGCGVDTYCPSTPVTRAQMAVFLVRTFNLP